MKTKNFFQFLSDMSALIGNCVDDRPYNLSTWDGLRKPSSRPDPAKVIEGGSSGGDVMMEMEWRQKGMVEPGWWIWSGDRRE